MLVSPLSFLRDARRDHWAVGAFNFSNLEMLQGIILGAEKAQAPVIIQTSEGALDYGGMQVLGAMAHAVASASTVPIAFHLDHGTNIALVKSAILSGLYTSVMIDGSRFSFEKNVRITKEIVRLAHRRHMAVEAELGSIPGEEDRVRVSKSDAYLTRPEDARRFVKETGCDTLAVSIGTKHGIRKFFSANARLDIKRLQLIQKNVSVPLVLHGASSLPSHVKDVAEQYGADLSHAYGVSKVQLKQAIQHGISKINTDSDLRIAFSGAVDRAMTRRPNNLDPRSYLGEGRAAVARIVESKLALFGAAHRV